MTRTFEEYQQEKREREWSDRVKKQKEAMGNDERVQRATDWKRIGNEKVRAGNLQEARDYYREAIIFVEDLVEARRKERVELLVPLYCNLAQVHLKLAESVSAEDVAGKALAIAEIPRNSVHASFRAKAHFRRGLARRLQGKLEEARDDLAAALLLQPQAAEVAQGLADVRAALAAQAREARASMGGFLSRGSAQRQREERRRQEEEQRRERRARAEQRQQMQQAFKRLSQGEMLYEKREEEMEPIRKKEQEKRQTLELEKNLLNIIDDSKGLPKTADFDEFMSKKYARCKEQSSELDQKKKILDKKKKEQQWEEDDVWKGQRDDHRRRLEAEQQTSTKVPGPRSLWESKEVARWCEQRLRDHLLGTFVEGEELKPQLVNRAFDKQAASCGDYVLRALITDVLKLTGDAAVVRLNLSKPPLHYYDYFLKLDWEVAVARQRKRSYRTAEELIQVAADVDDGKAPPSVTEHRLLGGTFKVREFCSEAEPLDGAWPLVTKVKQRCEARGEELLAAAELLRDSLRDKVARLLCRWTQEYRGHWS